MKDLQIFKSPEFGQVRVIENNGEGWLVGKDIADALGYAEPHKAIDRHVDEEDRTKHPIPTNGGLQESWIINESGLYSLVLSSKLPTAKKFKKWVTSEVLPTIRKHGMYATEELLNDPDLAIKAFTALKEERQKRLEAEQQIQLDKPKVLFAEAVEVSKSSILIGELAKILKQNGIEIGQNRLFAWMREEGYLCKSGENYNLPTQYSMELGLFEIKKTTINNPDGSVRVTRTTKVTGKGQIYFVNKFRNGEEIA